MYALKSILGHAKIELTVDFYWHFTAEHVERVSPYDEFYAANLSFSFFTSSSSFSSRDNSLAF